MYTAPVGGMAVLSLEELPSVSMEAWAPSEPSLTCKQPW